MGCVVGILQYGLWDESQIVGDVLPRPRPDIRMVDTGIRLLYFHE